MILLFAGIVFPSIVTILSCAFVPFASTTRWRSDAFDRERRPFVRVPSSNERAAGNDVDDDADALRRLLEESWSANVVDGVPSAPEEGARATARAVGAALKDGHRSVRVEVSLPSYEPTSGPRVYDEAALVGFCAALAEALRDETSSTSVRRSLILVRDAAAARVARGVLEGERLRQETRPMRENEQNEKDDDDDVDEFRRRMMADWDGDDHDDDDSATSHDDSATSHDDDDVCYRIDSVFGTREVPDNDSLGPDTMEQVVRAVDRHDPVSDDDDDEAIMLLSTRGVVETIGARRLLARYGDRRVVILVNFRADPLPRELVGVPTAYGLTPLVARPVAAVDGATSSSSSPIRAVVSRRYPRDWELFVDVDGSGFELTDSVAAGQVGPRGPLGEWIGTRVRRYVEFRNESPSSSSGRR